MATSSVEGRRPYATDLTVAQWSLIEPLLPPPDLKGRHEEHPRREIERSFDADAVRELQAESAHDLSVDGPNRAVQAIAAGLVDESHLFITTSVVGGGSSLRAFDSISNWSRSVPSTTDCSTRTTGPAESHHDQPPRLVRG